MALTAAGPVAGQEAGWELDVLLNPPPGLTERIRPLFARQGDEALRSPVLGSWLLGRLEAWDIVGPWPGLPDAAGAGPAVAMERSTGTGTVRGQGRLAGDVFDQVERPGDRLTEWRRPGESVPRWTVALRDTPGPIASLRLPFALPLVTWPIEVPTRDVVWIVSHDPAGDPAWAAAFGPVDGSGALVWHGLWRSAAGEGPRAAWHAPAEVPPALVRHAQATYGSAPLWSPAATAVGAVTSVRYNQVEGASVQVPVRLNLSPVVSLHGSVRPSTSSYALDWEAGVTWQRWPIDWGVEGYRRLEDANHWDPATLKPGNSFTAALFGTDYGHYYTAQGASLFGEYHHGTTTWRVDLFAESDRPAPRRVDWSLFTPDPDSLPAGLEAEPGDYYGVGLLWDRQHGLALDRGVWLTRWWARAATGTREFVRVGAMVDALRSWGPWAGAVRFGGGVVFGDAPAQREYFLGGLSTIRGFDTATLQGPVVALGRVELGYGPPVLRLVGFSDFGWAGTVDALANLTSVGVGLSLAEGMARVDLGVPVSGGEGLVVHFITNSLL